MGMSGDLDVRIDELVLHGFAPHEQHRIRDTLEQALARLFRERGIPPGLANGAASPSLDAGDFGVAAGSSPSALGERIALALYERLGTVGGRPDLPGAARQDGKANDSSGSATMNSSGGSAIVGGPATLRAGGAPMEGDA
jgi:hypothetical protein